MASKLVTLALAAGISLLSLPVFAAGNEQVVATSNLKRGNAPMPEFRLGSVLQDFGTSGFRRGIIPESDLMLDFALPDNGGRMLFSPRPQIGLDTSRDGGKRAYVGLTWGVFDSGALYGHVGIAGSYSGSILNTDPRRQGLGPPLLLHGAFELGYRFADRQSLSLSIDQATAPAIGEKFDSFESLRVRYGYRF